MSILTNRRNSFSSKDFKLNSQMIQANQLNVELFQDVVKNQVQKNKLVYMHPANVGAALIHRQANKYGYHPKIRGEPTKVCACCEEPFQNEEIPICYSTTSFNEEQKLGYEEFKLQPGIALFFQFIKLAIFYIIFRILLCDTYNIVTNILGSFCQEISAENPCQPSLWNYLSILNLTYSYDKLFIQYVLDLVTVVLSIIIFFFLRKKQYNFFKELKQKKQSEDTYTILVSGIPLIDFPTSKQLKKMKKNSKKMELWHRKHLWKFFEKKIKKWLKNSEHWKLSKGTTEHDFHEMKEKNGGELRSNEIVTSVSLVYNLGRLEILQNKKDDLIDRQAQYEKIRAKLDEELSEEQGEKSKQFGVEPLDEDVDSRFSTIPKQVEFLSDCEILLSKQYASDNSVLFNMTNLMGYAFISFQYQHYKEYILGEASKKKSFLSYNGVQLKVQNANEAADVNWQNFRHSQSKRRKRILTTITFVALTIIITFVLVSVLQYFRLSELIFAYQMKQSAIGNIFAYLMILAIILVIMFGNFVIRKVAKHFVSRQKHKSKAQAIVSQLRVTTFGQFVNSAIVLFVVSQLFSLPIGNMVGLVTIVTGYMVIQVIWELIIQLVYPASIWNSLKFCCKYRNFSAEDNVQKFQIKLNGEYDYEDFQIVNKYSKYLSLWLFASFYAHLTPIIMPALAIFMILIYWIDKINMFRRSKIHYRTNYHVSRSALKIFESSIIFFSLGAFIISFESFDQFSYMHLIALAISFLFVLFLLLIPYGTEKKIFASYESSEKETYDDCIAEGKFERTYWTSNPATYIVKQSDIIDRKSIYNPTGKKIYMNEYPQHK